MVRKLLFFDDQPLERRDNIVRRLGKPQYLPESEYRDPVPNTTWAYPTVFRDPASGIWRMLYMGGLEIGDHTQHVPLIAESVDGLHWHPRDTTAELDLPDRLLPHQVGIPIASYGEWSQPFIDERAPADERLKGLVVLGHGSFGSETTIWTSGDGLHWKQKLGVNWQDGGPDPVTSVFWNQVRQSYVLTSRPSGSDRRMTIFESRDWNQFSEPQLVMAGDALDAPLTEVYGMPVFAYDQYFVALIQLFHTIPQAAGWKFVDGHVDCQLAYSLNGWYFQRSLREPFIANGEPDQPHYGCVYPTSLITLPDGSIRIYAGACRQEHGYRTQGIGAVIAFSLRQDGFVYLESANGIGRVGTRPVLWNKGDLQVNIESQNGYAKVQVIGNDLRPLIGYSFEDSVPFSGNNCTWVPTWKSGVTMAALAGKPVRFEIEIQTARLYSLRGDFRGITQHDASMLQNNGLIPPDRTGFF